VKHFDKKGDNSVYYNIFACKAWYRKILGHYVIVLNKLKKLIRGRIKE